MRIDGLNKMGLTSKLHKAKVLACLTIALVAEQLASRNLVGVKNLTPLANIKQIGIES